MNRRGSNITLLVLAVVLFVFLAVANIVSSNQINTKLKENVASQLAAAIEPNLISFELQIKEQIKKVNTLAAYFGEDGNLLQESHVNVMRIAVEQNGLLRCAVSDKTGKFLTHDNQTGDATGMQFFETAMLGNFHISDPQPAVVDPDKTVILFTSPIINQGETVGALTYSYLCGDIDRIFTLDFFKGKGNLMVVNGAGDILIGGGMNGLKEGDNVLASLREECLAAEKGHENHIPQKLDDAPIAHFTVETPTVPEGLLVSSAKLAFNDWYMLALVPTQAVNETVFLVTDVQRNLSIAVFAGVIIFFVALVVTRFFLIRNLDPLTKAPRLEYFKRTAKKVLKKNPENRFIFVKLDLKDFKLINCIYNFKEGDRVICNMANALQDTLKGLDATYARVEADVFVIVLPFVSREELGKRRAQFIQTFRQLMGKSFTTYTCFPTGQYITGQQDALSTDIAAILEKVNFAHSFAKRNETDMIVDYEDNIEKEALIQKEIEDKMDAALQSHDYKLYIQPKVRIQGEKLCGGEALVRWVVRDVPIMHPAEFVPALERNGFIVKLDMYMFEQTVSFIRGQLDQNLQPVPISVNFSRHHLNNTGFVQELVHLVEMYNVPPALLEIELTESTVFENMGRILEMIEQLHKAGFRIAMDDFGSGYSSLGFLKDLKVDVIKIDKGFFQSESDQARNRIVLAHIFAMAMELETETVAEGVEHREQVELLRKLGCDVIQGYFFDYPMPAETFHNKYFS